jgi:hypothetical protein
MMWGLAMVPDLSQTKAMSVTLRHAKMPIYLEAKGQGMSHDHLYAPPSALLHPLRLRDRAGLFRGEDPYP